VNNFLPVFILSRVGKYIILYMGKHNVNSFVIGQDYRVHSGRLASALAGASDGTLLDLCPHRAWHSLYDLVGW